MRNRHLLAGASILLSLLACAGIARGQQPPASSQGGAGHSWHAADRAEKVARLIPGRGVRRYTPETLYADWTAEQVKRWEAQHGALNPAALYEDYARRAPADDRVRGHFPRHISPFGRVLEGNAPAEKRNNVMISWCPFCDRHLSLRWKADDPYTATTSCGVTLYAREKDFPKDYRYRPTRTVDFHHLDTVVKAPAYVHTDKDGVTWELFLQTVVDHRLWVHYDMLTQSYAKDFVRTADPFYAHKIALLLDEIAETYRGLPPSFRNQVATGKGGRPLKRAEWEALERPLFFEQAAIGHWNRKRPLMNRGWAIAESADNAWAGPFALVRHHPVFKYYSLKKYGDADELDRRIRQKILREAATMHTAGVLYTGHALTTSYQYATYYPLMVLGLLIEDPIILDFAAPSLESTLYNHHYHDGLNGEGSPDYMGSLGRYYRWMSDPAGWLYFYPDFLKEQPFFSRASREFAQLRTARGLPLEFGDKHILAWPPAVNRPAPATDLPRVAAGRALPSRNWPAYGVGLLRVGRDADRMEASLTYTKASMHGKSDVLGLSVWVDGYPVIRYGGYAHAARAIDPARDDDRTLMELPYPHPVEDGGGKSWVRQYTTTPLAQNTLIVDETAPACYGPSEGLPQLVSFKGGEAADEPGARFQVLEAHDDYAFKRVGRPVSDFRRALIGVETPSGRPYLLDITRVVGGNRHLLTYGGWGEVAAEEIDAPAGRSPNLADFLESPTGPGIKLEALGQWWSGGSVRREQFERVRSLRQFRPRAGRWGVTWKTDYGAWGPRPLEGGQYVRPLPEDTGRVRMRLTGLGAGGEASILRAKGPWIAAVNQPLPGGRRYSGNLAFRDAVDLLCDIRQLPAGARADSLHSTFVYVMEGFREGGQPALAGAMRLAAPGNAVALQLELADGGRDIVVYRPGDGEPLRLESGLETDARYALARLDRTGEVVEGHLVGGSYLRYRGQEIRGQPQRRGTIEDITGDLTGTRGETAFTIRTTEAWPEGQALAGRDITVTMPNPRRAATRETYTIKTVRRLAENRYRVELAGHPPLAKGWHSVARLDPEQPHTFMTNRPIHAGANSPWMWGNRAWFPEKGREYLLERTQDMSGGGGGHIAWLEKGVDLVKDGIEIGDWCVIYEIRPGQEVTVPSRTAWQRK